MPRRTKPKLTLQEKAIADAIQDAREYKNRWEESIKLTLKNLFFSRFTFEGAAITEEAEIYLKSILWWGGQVIAFPLTVSGNVDYIGTPAYLEDASKILCFAKPASDSKVSIYRFPVSGRPSKENGIPNYPYEQLTYGKQAILVYALPDRQPVYDLISAHVDEMVRIKNAMRLNLMAGQELPVFAFDDGNAMVRGARLQEAVREGAAFSYVPVKDVDTIKSVGAGSSFQLTELRNAYNAVFNEALTILGVDNVGQSAKQERNTIDEVNANNSIVNLDRILTKNTLDKCVENIREVLGFDIRLKDNAESIASIHEEINDKDPNEEEEQTDETPSEQ